jgi:PAS domain S-box-containing protein
MRRLLADLVLVLCASPGKTCTESEVMMARVRPNGIFEVLSAAAWARSLGYAPDELSGKSLRELMQLEKRAAHQVVAALLDKKDAQPVDVTLRCKDEQRKSFRFHRRFDAYQDAMYVVADELPEGRFAPLRAYGS